MDYNGSGLTFQRHYAAGAHRRRGAGAGLTYRSHHGAGAMDPVVTPLAAGDYAGAIQGAATLALGALVQYYIIKYAVRAARR